MMFEEIHDKLLDHETFIKREEGKKINSPITAQFTQWYTLSSKTTFL